MAKHLSLEDRNLIAQRLKEGCFFQTIAKELEKFHQYFQGNAQSS